MSSPTRIGVLGSGSGSNFQALLDAIKAGELDAEIVLAMSDHRDAFLLERAQRVGIPTQWIDCQGFQMKFPEEVQQQVAETLLAAGVELVCLAGFMRLVKEPLLKAFPQRILNIHPSLLPEFPGLAAWEQAHAAKVKRSGCTVHFVDAGMDTGPILLQAEVPVFEDDTAKSLHQRIQAEEHRIYPEAVRMWQTYFA